jgi:hypothetical protein
MPKDNLIEYALAGYSTEGRIACPHYYSSPASIAWHAGLWMHATGRSKPVGTVAMSRGYSIRVNDMILEWQRNDALKAERQFVRLS